MPGKRNTERIVALIKETPGMKAEPGTKHWKIIHRGRQICILPYHQRTEGISANIACKLRKAGVKL